MAESAHVAWVRFFVADWRSSAAVTDMTLAERGAFLELLMLQAASGPFAWDPERLTKQLRCLPGEIEAAWPIVSKCFDQASGGLWQNAKMAEEIARGEARREGAQKAAKASARARSKATDAYASAPAPAHASASTDACTIPTPTPTPTPSSDTDSESGSKKERRKRPSSSAKKPAWDHGLPERLAREYGADGIRVEPAVREWAEQRKRIRKPVSKQGVARALTDLAKHSSGNPDTAIEIAHKAADGCWLSFYPLRESSRPLDAGGYPKGHPLEFTNGITIDPSLD